MREVPWRLAFFGTPAFAVTSLRKLIDCGFVPGVVVTQPDRPVGRGLRMEASPIKRLAQATGLPVLTPERLSTDRSIADALHSLQPAVAIVVAYGNLIPRELLSLPVKGFLNLHPSLLPRYRGASPIQAAIRNGDAETGVSLMRLEERLDAGPVYAVVRVPIQPEDTGATLSDRLSQAAADLLLANLEAILRGHRTAVPQNDTLASTTAPLTRDDGRLDWSLEARLLERTIRAFHPWPGTWTVWRGQHIKILAARVCQDRGVPGRVFDRAPLRVGCGEGSLTLEMLQFAGGRVLAAPEALRGYPLLGTMFGAGG